MRKIATILILIILAAATASAASYEFKAKNADGVTICYVLEQSSKTAKVVSGDVKYSGVVNIPERVTDKKEEYVVTSIGENAFRDCGALTSVTIPNSVTSIGAYAFKGCDALTSVAIPNSVINIGDLAFRNCHSLASVTIPNSVTEIRWGAFEECSSLTSMTIPNSVTSIGNCAFGGCHSLTSVKIPNSVTEIGKDAFYYCKSLTSVAIPNSVTSIHESAFSGCSLKTVYIQEGTPHTSPIRQYFKNSGIELAAIADNDPRWGGAIVPAFDPKAFPVLAVESVTFGDNGDNAIEANEACTISVKISNSGKGAARGCTLKAISNAPGISVSDVKLPDIAPGTTYTAKVNVKAGMSTVNGKAEFSVMVDEPNGLGTDPDAARRRYPCVRGSEGGGERLCGDRRQRRKA